jgi:hypothetical protein
VSAELLRTPTCEVTGLPLPILPKEPSSNEAPFSFPPNLHHHFHPEKIPALLTVAGLAVRGCRVQRVNFRLHNDYHKLFSGPELPADDDQSFRTVVLCAAGVVPRMALDLSKRGDYQEVPLSNYNHSFLSRTKIINIGAKESLAVFLAEYAAQQGVEELVDNRILDEFLDKWTAKKRKNEIARLMLTEALGLSLEDINPSYNDFKKEGYLRPRSETLHKVTKRLIRCHSLGHFRQSVENRLVTA